MLLRLWGSNERLLTLIKWYIHDFGSFEAVVKVGESISH